MNKDRLLNFTDAVIAIIVTIMLLDLKVPDRPTVHALSLLIEPVIAYVLSFLTLFIAWYSHHQLFKNISTITYKIFWYNTLWVLLMSFTPLTTAWVGQNIWALLPELVFAIQYTLWLLCYHLLLAREILRQNKKSTFESAMNSRVPTILRSISIFINFTLIWIFPPITLVLVFVGGLLHVLEHLRFFEKKGIV